MTLQLAVRITGEASSLVATGREAKGVITEVGTAATAAGGKAEAAARDIDRVTEATNALATAERNQATAATGAAEAIDAVARATGAVTQAQASATAAASGQAAAAKRVAAEIAEAGRQADVAQRKVAEFMAGGIAPRPTSGLPAAAPAAPIPPPAPAPRSPAPVPAQSPGPANQNFRPDQWKNLGFQANDIATSLFSGIPVTQVLAQQGGQVAQVLGDAPGGIAGGLKIVAGRAMEILTPVRLMTAGFVGAGAAVAYLGVTWARSQEEIRVGLLGIGAQSRATVADLNRIAETAAGGGKIGRADARSAAAAVASTGKVDLTNIQDIVNLAPGFSKLFGKDLKDTGADLARIFADPVKGAAELDARIGGLDARTQNYIRTLSDQGNRQEAVRLTIRAFGPELEAAAEKTSLWAKAWGLVTTAAEATGRIVSKPFVANTPQQQLEVEQQALRRLRSQTGIPTGQDRFGKIGAQEAKVAVAQKAVDDAAAAPRIKAAAELSQQAEAAVRALQPEINQLEKLTSGLLLLQKTQGDLDALSGMSAEARKQLTDALAAAKGGIDSFMSAQDKARTSETLTIRSIEARTVAEKAAIAAERERLNLAGQAISEDDRRQRIEAARKAVLAQSTRDSQDRLRGANDNAASAGLPSYQRQIADLEAKYRKIYEDDAGNLPAIANDQKSKAAERQAIDKEAIGGPLRDANRSIAEQVAALKIQQDAFGASTEAATRMAAAQQLVNQYTAAGVPITAEIKRGIDAYAASAGKIAAAQEDLVPKQREVIGGLDDIRSGTRSGVTGIFSDVSKGRSPLDGITSSLDSMTSRLVDRSISTPLANSLFGQDGKPGGGLLGDTLGGFFGKQAGLSTADITAGVVNVNGTISGIPGLGGTAANGNVPNAASIAAGLGGGGSTDAAKKILSGLSGSKTDVAAYVQQAAVQRGIDPSVALRVINQESGFNTAARNLTSKEQSYGVMQLNTQGGLGVDALKAGIDVRDPSTWRQQVDFGLDTVKKDGWRQWYGARDIGVSRWEGIGQGGPATTAAMPDVRQLDTSLKSINTSAAAASQGVTGLTGDLTSLPGPLAQTSQGLTQVGNSLGSGGSGGGLLGALANLFGGGASASAAPATVAAAGGGHIRGPGTSTSDSIPAWLSDGEFVVNAAATKRNLPFLHALNDNRMPAFAAGGPVGNPASAGGSAGGEGAPMQVNFYGAPSTPRLEERRDSRGGRRLDVVFDETAAAAVSRPGSKTAAALAMPRIGVR